MFYKILIGIAAVCGAFYLGIMSNPYTHLLGDTMDAYEVFYDCVASVTLDWHLDRLDADMAMDQVRYCEAMFSTSVGQ